MSANRPLGPEARAASEAIGAPIRPSHRGEGAPAAPAWPVRGESCWRIERAERFKVILDAADYFEAVRSALLKARHSVFLIGWDFDTRVTLGSPGPDEGPATVGDFLLWLADRRPDLQVRVLRWRAGAIRTLFKWQTLVTVMRWKAHPRITMRLDAMHPFGASHHQKIVVIDDCLAFCGGIDMTSCRWDTPEHLDDDPRRISPGGLAHPPWHDSATVFDGAAARAMADLARERWQLASGDLLTPVRPATNPWPGGLTPDLEGVALAIARTRPKMARQQPHHEVEAMVLGLIARARQHIYMESQYFASRRIARAIALRLIEEDPPEIVVVTPAAAEGWLEPLAMDTARARLTEALMRIDHAGRLRIYHPQTAGGQGIYVHSKLMSVDDRWLRVGSSNVNNRSMRLDSECDVLVGEDLSPAMGTEAAVRDLRARLLAEHLGVAAADYAAAEARHGGMIGAIEALRGPGRSLTPYEVPEISGFAGWLAENEILDPDGPDDLFESPARRGLFKGWDRIRRKIRARRSRARLPGPAGATPGK